MSVFFSDYFEILPEILDDYGALDISLINDLPVFVDPFLLFNSKSITYKELHDDIIRYLRFLRDRSVGGEIRKGLIRSWFLFPEVKQNWLGYSKIGNRGSGLGPGFAAALNRNLNTIFVNFGNEQITTGSHLEKLCLVKGGVGRDNISDFTTNLIKGFLCQYTERFANRYLDETKAKKVLVPRVSFNYHTRIWIGKEYFLPFTDGDYILLTPKDILTKDEAWINKNDVYRNFHDIQNSIPNGDLRAQLNEYFLRMLPKDADSDSIKKAKDETIERFPTFLDYYVKYKEDNGDKAEKISNEKIKEIVMLFNVHTTSIIEQLAKDTRFFESKGEAFEEAYQRVQYLKQVIENNDGYRWFYVKGKVVKRESDLQLLFRLVWFSTEYDVNAEVNNGRGPVDYKISRGYKDKVLVEFKLASNSQLRRNLMKQVEVYEKANKTKKSIKVILFFSDSEEEKVHKIFKDLKLKEGKEIVLIDARKSNKVSASKA
ncbi:MAG: hypothetical protein HQL54_11690 [Magnetococcales bacterium]|nr:hypothetical protein [Magnetococcales bacterium]